MTAALARPPPLPFQREEWLAEALAALDALGPPRQDAGAVALDLAPCVVLTAQGGGLSRTWVLFEPFRVERLDRCPGRPGAPFVVLNAKAGGLSRTWVLWAPFRVRPLRQVQAAAARPAPAPVAELPAVPAPAPAARPRRSRRRARTARARRPGRLASWHRRGAAARQEALAASSPPPAAPVAQLEAAPVPSTWDGRPSTLPDPDQVPPSLRWAVIAEQRRRDLAWQEGEEGAPTRAPARPHLPPAEATTWPKRRRGEPSLSEFWEALAAAATIDPEELRQLRAAARASGFKLEKRTHRTTRLPWLRLTVQDAELRALLGDVVVRATRCADVLEELRRLLRKAGRKLPAPPKPKRPRRKKPAPAAALPAQLGLAVSGQAVRPERPGRATAAAPRPSPAVQLALGVLP